MFAVVSQSRVWFADRPEERPTSPKHVPMYLVDGAACAIKGAFIYLGSPSDIEMYISILSTPVLELQNFNPDRLCKPGLLFVVALVTFFMIVNHEAIVLSFECIFQTQ